LYDYAEAKGLAGEHPNPSELTDDRRPMPDCNETIRELDAFLDGELSPTTSGPRSTITSTGCPDCHQAFDFHAELKQSSSSSATATRCRPACSPRSNCASTPTSTATAVIGPPTPAEMPGVRGTTGTWLRLTGYADRMLAANIWHWWIGVILLLVSLLAVAWPRGGYLKRCPRQKYPPERARWRRTESDL
jgi:hypothetical protein